MANALQPAVVEEEEDTNEEWLLALLAVLLLINGNPARPLNTAQRRRARTLLRTKFENDTNRLAVGVAGAMTVATWLEEMQTSIGDYARQMAVAGAGTLPIVATRAVVDARLREQLPFLQRFGRLIATGAMSEAAIAARSKLYGGTGWESYWRGAESSLGRQRGVIVHYIARDDRGTCSRCSEAARNGPYAAGTDHPYPGSVCLGGGRCRCELRFEFNPETYAGLARHF